MSRRPPVTEDAIRAALALSPRVEARPDLDSSIARAIRTTRQDRPPMVRLLGRRPELPLPGLRIVRIGFLLALLLAIVGMALLVGALLRRPVLPGNGTINLVVNDRLIEVAPNGTGARLILPGNTAAGGPVWSRDGSHLAVWVNPGTALSGQAPAARPSISVLAADGTTTATVTTAQMSLGGRAVAMNTGTISWSPDGTGFALDGAVGGLAHLYRYDLATGIVSDITPPGVQGQWPAWSPDGRLIAFFSPQSGQDDRVWVMQPDGSGAHRMGDPLPKGLATGSGSWAPQWSPDSARLAFDASNGISNSALYVVNLATGRQVRLGADLRAAFAPAWGPGPTDLAFQDRNGSVPGKIDVYVSNPDAGTVRLLLPNADLWGWAPDGSSLLIGSPSCWSDNHGMTTPCANGVFSVTLDGTVQRELVSATQLASLAPNTPTTVMVGVEAAAWRPVRP